MLNKDHRIIKKDSENIGKKKYTIQNGQKKNYENYKGNKQEK